MVRGDRSDAPAVSADSSSRDDDRALVARFVASREEAAFRALYRRHAPFLYRFLLRLSGGDGAAAEEGVQETWIRAAQSLPDFAWRSSLKTWLAGIAIRSWREARRTSGREVEFPEEATLPAARPIRSEIARVDLERALAALPAGYRRAILLHDVEGYTHEEVAELTGVDIGTSKSQLSRARSALRARLSGRDA
jgi:RNA polymerase sigma-70 factor (ECF subfamily)